VETSEWLGVSIIGRGTDVEADGEIGLEFSISGLFIAFSSITTKTSD
jgi:hypothetical protein